MLEIKGRHTASEHERTDVGTHTYKGVFTGIPTEVGATTQLGCGGRGPLQALEGATQSF